MMEKAENVDERTEQAAEPATMKNLTKVKSRRVLRA